MFNNKDPRGQGAGETLPATWWLSVSVKILPTQTIKETFIWGEPRNVFLTKYCFIFLSFIPHKCLYRLEHVIGRQPFVCNLFMIYTIWASRVSPVSPGFITDHPDAPPHHPPPPCNSTYSFLILRIWRQSWWLDMDTSISLMGLICRQRREDTLLHVNIGPPWLGNSYWRLDKNLSKLKRRNGNYCK